MGRRAEVEAKMPGASLLVGDTGLISSLIEEHNAYAALVGS